MMTDKKNNDHDCCTHDDLNSEGTSRLTRILKILDPVNAPIDPRGPEDILVFAKRYAELVRFYDMDDTVDCVDFTEVGVVKQLPATTGATQYEQKNIPEEKKNIVNWKEFFYKDIAVVVASISQYQDKLLQIRNEYNGIHKEIESAATKENFRKIFLSIIHHLKRINRWYERSIDEHPLKKELFVKINSFLAPALQKLMAYDKGFMSVAHDDLDLTTEYESFKATPWNADFAKVNPDASIYVGSNVAEKIKYALLYVDDIFNTLYKAYDEITGRSSFYWNQAVENFPSHQPHMALFITFVELFSYAQDELNGLTKRHLDFFYRDILHLKEKPAGPDSVYLIYQLAKGVDEYDLAKRTELTAGKDKLGKQQIYKTDKELVINKATVKEIKTIFLDKGSPIENIYAAPVANSADGKGEKFKDPETAWSTFGYFEPRTDADKITGEKAKIGFAIASPQFALSGGERTIIIKLKLANVPADDDHANLKKSFKIENDWVNVQFSGAKEWIGPEYEVDIEDDNDKVGELFSSGTRERILNFISTAKTPEDIAGVEHEEGPVFDNPVTQTNKREDYDIGLTLAKKIYGHTYSTLSALIDAKIGLGKDKMSDLIYSFSNQYVAWNANGNELIIKATLHNKQDAIVPFNAKNLKEPYTTELPLCKISFTSESKLYDQFKDTVVQTVDIFVRVDGLTEFLGENDDGPFQVKKPVDILTAFPRIGSAFSFGSPELENKKLTKIAVRGEWMGDLDFADRYLLYDPDRTNPADFICDYELFYNNRWNAVDKSTVHLFQTKDKRTAETDLSFTIVDKNLLSGDAQSGNSYQFVRFVLNELDFGHEEYPVLTAYQLANRLNSKGEPVTATPTPGTPTVPQPNAAGKPKKTLLTPKEKLDDSKVFIPNPPYTPRVKSFTLNYTAVETLDTLNGQFFHIYPFGETEIFSAALIKANHDIDDILFIELLDKEKKSDQLIIPSTYLLPQFKFGTDANETKKLKDLNVNVGKKHKEFISKSYFQLNQYESLTDQQGSLYIGIENLVPPQNLSLLFKFADGTAYDNDSEPPTIHWSYLVNNEWIPLPQDNIISDSTYGFQTAGIILIDFPENATNQNTILTTGLHWLCASIDNGADKIPKLIDVVAQANQATFFDQQNDPAHYKNPLPAETISKPLVKIAEVKSIEQPFESFDGRPAEEGLRFYQRVSERLRHKNRAITPWDYEHLVLEQFPSVYKVKILTHTDPECLCRHEHEDEKARKDDCCCPQAAPGHVLVVAVSNLRNKNAIDPLKPRTGRRTLLQIGDYLKKITSPFVHVHVKNPKFEEVKVSFNVKFYTGIDKGFYRRKLNEDIIHYLTPWAYDSNVEVLFGNKFYASKIINFIEELEYVDYITCFTMIHINTDCCENDVDLSCDEMQSGENADRFINEVSATSTQAILVSAKQHCINLIEEEPVTDDCNCQKKDVKPTISTPATIEKKKK